MIENELVVYRKRQRKTLTTSLIVAEKFRKQHKHVMDKIEKLRTEDEEDRPNFRLISYTDSMNRERKMYEMDKHGFIILAMRFTGKKALKWQHRFVDAFEAMEKALLNQRNIDWQEARLKGKAVRHELTDEIQTFIEYAEGQGSGNASRYYMQITKMTNQALFLIGQKAPDGFRDMLDRMQLNFLETAEFIARNTLKEGMTLSMFYKDIYALARDKVTAFAVTVGQTAVDSPSFPEARLLTA